MDHPKAAKTRLLAGRKRAKRQKHEARCPVELASPTQRTEEPESHPRKGGHWIGNPELKAPREKRKRPRETGRPGTSEQEPQGWRTSLERQRRTPCPQRQRNTMGKGRDVARSNTRTAKPASDTTTLLPGEKRRRSRGTLHRDKPLERER